MNTHRIRKAAESRCGRSGANKPHELEANAKEVLGDKLESKDAHRQGSAAKTGLTFASVTIGTLMLAGATLAPATASDSNEPDAIEAIEMLTPAALTKLAGENDLYEQSGGVETVVNDPNGAAVALPNEPADPLVLKNSIHSDIEVVLPIDSAVVDESSNGALVYSAGLDAQLVPLLKNDGSVQVTTVLSSQNAPTHYDYTFAPGTGVQLTEDGYVILTDENGKYSGAVMPAWAIDASGAEVPTHFEVNGAVLTQVVEHAGAEYPVVADPHMGKALISSVKVSSEKGKPRYSVTKTTWGNTVAIGYGLGLQENPLLGALIMRNAGWKEAVAKGLNTATTIRQQYDCHTVYAAGKNPWNLERWRGTNASWVTNPQLCNWNW